MIKSITLYDSLKKKQFLEALYEKKTVMVIKLLEKNCVVFISLPSHQLTIRSPPI